MVPFFGGGNWDSKHFSSLHRLTWGFSTYKSPALSPSLPSGRVPVSALPGPKPGLNMKWAKASLFPGAEAGVGTALSQLLCSALMLNGPGGLTAFHSGAVENRAGT